MQRHRLRSWRCAAGAAETGWKMPAGITWYRPARVVDPGRVPPVQQERGRAVTGAAQGQGGDGGEGGAARQRARITH